jgi:hypothetical protein
MSVVVVTVVASVMVVVVPPCRCCLLYWYLFVFEFMLAFFFSFSLFAAVPRLHLNILFFSFYRSLFYTQGTNNTNELEGVTDQGSPKHSMLSPFVAFFIAWLMTCWVYTLCLTPREMVLFYQQGSTSKRDFQRRG